MLAQPIKMKLGTQGFSHFSLSLLASRLVLTMIQHCQFSFQNWKYLAATEGSRIMLPEQDPLSRPLPTPQDYIDYLDPFNCECRAYGRLKQEEREDLAIRAHGYVLLSKNQERHVTEAMTGDFVDWEEHPEPLDCDGLFWRWEDHRHEPLRAIVKDYDTSSTSFTPAQVPQVYRDLEELHRLGILVRDLHAANYLGGKLIDFSMAWTMYHICVDRTSPLEVKRMRSAECDRFEATVTQVAAEDDWEEDDITLPEELLRWHSNKVEDLGCDIRLYDWQKWDKTG